MLSTEHKETLSRLGVWSDFQSTQVTAHIGDDGKIHHPGGCYYSSDTETRPTEVQAIPLDNDRLLCICASRDAWGENSWMMDLMILANLLDEFLRYEEALAHAGTLSPDTPSHIITLLVELTTTPLVEVLTGIQTARNSHLPRLGIPLQELDLASVPTLLAHAEKLDDEVQTQGLDSVRLQELQLHGTLLRYAAQSVVLRHLPVEVAEKAVFGTMFIAWEQGAAEGSSLQKRKKDALTSLRGHHVRQGDPQPLEELLEEADKVLALLEDHLPRELAEMKAGYPHKVRLAAFAQDSGSILGAAAYTSAEQVTLRQESDFFLVAAPDAVLAFLALTGQETSGLSPEHVYFTPSELEAARVLWNPDPGATLSDLTELAIACKQLTI